MKKVYLTLLSLITTLIIQAQSLEALMDIAEDNNPEIQAFELRYSIAQEKIEESNTLPNTELGAGVFISEPETRTGAQLMRFSARQMLPWFGTITARENYANSLAEVDYLDIVITKRKLRLAIAQSYYNLYTLKAKKDILDENIQLLKTYENLALTSVEVGTASAVDVLRLQIRQNELNERREIFDHEYNSQLVNLNNLLNRNIFENVQLPDTLILETGAESRLENLEFHPELEKYDRLYESVTQSEMLNKKEANPSLGLGFDYIPVESRPNMDFADNGKDIFMPMVTFSIPLFNSTYKSRTIQNDLKQEMLSSQKVNRKNTLSTLLETALNDRQTAWIQYRSQLKSLAQAKDAEEILIKNYETGTIDFNDVLDVQELQLRIQLNLTDAILNYYTKMAVINYLTN